MDWWIGPLSLEGTWCGHVIRPRVTGHSTTRHSTTRHSTTHHSTTGHLTTGHSTTRHSTTRHSTTGHSTTRRSITGHLTTRHLTTGHLTTGHSITRHSTTRHSTTGHSTTGHCLANLDSISAHLWPAGVMVRALDARLAKGRWFDSRPFRCQIATLGKLFVHMCLLYQATYVGSGEHALIYTASLSGLTPSFLASD